jgi:hypothetical protein
LPSRISQISRRCRIETTLSGIGDQGLAARAAANVVYLEYPAMVLRRWFCAIDSMALSGMIFGG